MFLKERECILALFFTLRSWCLSAVYGGQVDSSLLKENNKTPPTLCENITLNVLSPPKAEGYHLPFLKGFLNEEKC